MRNLRTIILSIIALILAALWGTVAVVEMLLGNWGPAETRAWVVLGLLLSGVGERLWPGGGGE